MFEQEFEKMLRQHRLVIDDKKKFTGLVKDYFPDQAKSVNLLLMAYNMGIAQELDSASQVNNTFAFRYVKRLMDEYGLSRVNADWVVSVWCVCYGNRILGKMCDISLHKEGTGPAISEEKSSVGKQYGDLFTYKQSQQGVGLGVTGFHGEKKQTIIFQNRCNNSPVIEICDSAFEGGEIEAAIMTDGIAYIGKASFANCDSLHQVVMPYSVKEIGDSAFANCANLKSVSLPVQLERIGENAFRGCGLRTISFPQSIYWIGDGVLAECSELNNITITENIDRIPKGMFEGCTSLKKVTLHEKLDAIGDRAFFGCSLLDFLVIPDSVKNIGIDAFTGTDKQFIIQCSFGSYAEEYCRKNKIKYQLV